jgi:hypothetical protein
MGSELRLLSFFLSEAELPGKVLGVTDMYSVASVARWRPQPGVHEDSLNGRMRPKG